MDRSRGVKIRVPNEYCVNALVMHMLLTSNGAVELLLLLLSFVTFVSSNDGCPDHAADPCALTAALIHGIKSYR